MCGSKQHQKQDWKKLITFKDSRENIGKSDELKIIGFVGMPGSGKSVASSVARDMGIEVLVMGDVIRQEALRQGLEPTDQNLGKIGNQLRDSCGPAAVAEKTMVKAMATGKDIIVVDGLRSKVEADFFRANATEFYLIKICAPPEARLKWIEARGRSDDPSQRTKADSETINSCIQQQMEMAEALEERESRELSWGMREALLNADMKLRNNGGKDEFCKCVRQLLQNLSSKKISDNEDKIVIQ
jgi:dephospho-CoA kinase